MMDNLIAELEAAPAGSRELDASVWVAANGKGQPMKKVGEPSYKVPRFFCNPDPNVDWIGYDLLAIAPHYTTSLDAALTLIPEGWSLANLYDAVDPKDRPWVGAILRRDEPYYKVPEKIFGAPTYALAMCVAALRARQAIEGAA